MRNATWQNQSIFFKGVLRGSQTWINFAVLKRQCPWTSSTIQMWNMDLKLNDTKCWEKCNALRDWMVSPLSICKHYSTYDLLLYMQLIDRALFVFHSFSNKK